VTRLEAVRRALNLSQQDLARRVGISQGLLSSYERGLAIPSPVVAGKLGRALKVSASHLLDSVAAEEVRK
jgi:transcriptional regulator with XRE-family HTH domain